MIRWPDLSRFNADAVIFNGRHGVRVDGVRPDILAALKAETVTPDGIILLPDGQHLNSQILTDAFPGFGANDIKEIADLSEVAVLVTPVVEAKPVDEDASQKPKIDDVGEKIGGARKDFAKRALNISDAKGMNSTERDSLVTIQNIWPFSIRESLDDGMEPGVVQYILSSRKTLEPYSAFRKINAYENYPEEEVLKHYIDLISALRDNIVGVTTMMGLAEGIAAYYRDPRFDAAKAWAESAPSYIFTSQSWRWLANTYVNQIDGEGRRIGGYVEQPRNWQRKHAYLSDPENAEYAISKLLPTRRSKEDKAENDIEKRVARPHLDSLVDDYLDGGDHEAQELIDRFGFKGIEFGNWLPQDERQRVVNHAVAAFSAMADVLEIPESAISLGGELSIAFGARGTGGKRAPMAHYEPLRRVMNLTRLSGAGSIAHEYGHALDNMMGTKERWVGFNSDSAVNQTMTSIKHEMGTARALEKYVEDKMALIEQHSNWTMTWARSLVLDASTSSLIECGISGFKDGDAESNARVLSDVISVDSLQNLVPALPLDAVIEARRMRDEAAPKSPLLPYLLKTLMEGEAYSSAINNARYDEFEVFEVAHNRCGTVGIKLRDFYRSSSKSAHWQFQANVRTAIKNAVSIIWTMIPAWRRRIIASGEVTAPSRFFEDAKKIDEGRAKPYWSADIELFARAFEQFVHYELLNKGKRSEYLVHSVQSPDSKGSETGQPSAYPCERDRLVIRAAMREGVIPALHVALGVESLADEASTLSSGV